MTISSEKHACMTPKTRGSIATIAFRNVGGVASLQYSATRNPHISHFSCRKAVQNYHKIRTQPLNINAKHWHVKTAITIHRTNPHRWMHRHEQSVKRVRIRKAKVQRKQDLCTGEARYSDAIGYKEASETSTKSLHLHNNKKMIW